MNNYCDWATFCWTFKRTCIHVNKNPKIHLYVKATRKFTAFLKTWCIISYFPQTAVYIIIIIICPLQVTLMYFINIALTFNYQPGHIKVNQLVLSGRIRLLGTAVGWGTALQVRRSRVRFPMVSLEFFIDIILLAALWPWSRLSL